MMEWRKYTDKERVGIERFEAVCKEYVERFADLPPDRAMGQAANSIAIAARYFADGTSTGLGYRRRLLEIAAEATGIALVRLPQPDGTEAMAWPPVRGEVGWPPYEESPEAWAGAK